MADLKRVILYKHGVGYFEKEFLVKNREAVDLYFKSREMNDVLKSLTILDRGGGLVSSVSYDSTTPAEKLLEDVSIRLPDEGSLKSLLSQIKGARIEISVGKDRMEGAVVGLDPAIRREHDTVIQSYRLTILDSRGEMTSLDLEEIKTFRILDENIQKDLQFYLKTIIFSQKKDMKKLTIFTIGQGERKIQASYVLESPVWKTSYRIVAAECEKPFIQGWAVVDNTQDEDWENISLSLVSGLPVSFVHDLYNPRFKRRPVVEVRDETGVAPPSYEEGFTEGERRPSLAMQMDAFSAPPPPPPGSRAAMPMGPGMGVPLSPPAMMDLEKSVEVKTVTVKVGDFFAYHIDNPVTIQRNQSALVPIINQPFKGEKVLMYNEQHRAGNPMACMEMTNDTGLTLEGGPVTMYEGDTYVGESMLEFTKPDEKKYIPHAVELGCHIEKMEFFNDEPVFLVTLGGGAMRTHYYRTREKTYRIRYKNRTAIRLIIEHPREVDWELVETPAPVETTQNFYRFELSLPREGEYSLVVKDKRVFWTHYTLINLSDDSIALFLERKFFDARVADEIRKYVELSRKKADLEREINNNRASIQGIYKDQERLRSNISTLSTSREEAILKERFVTKLSLQESQIESHEKTIRELQVETEKTTKEIQGLITSLQLEVKL